MFSCVCVGIIASTDSGQRRVAGIFAPQDENRFATAKMGKDSPYSVDLALLQNELNRTKNEIRLASSEKQKIDQKLASLENRMLDMTTGSLGDTTPLPKRADKLDVPMKDIVTSSLPEGIVAPPEQKSNVVITYTDLPTYVEPEAPKMQAALMPEIRKTNQMEILAPKIESIVVPSPQMQQTIALNSAVPIPKSKPIEINKVADVIVPPQQKEAEIFTSSLPQKPITNIATPTRTTFAVQIGEDKSIASVRARWDSMIKQHQDVLAGLEPHVNMVEQKGKPLNMHLTVGPFRNAQEAATLCSQLTISGTACSVGTFNGQRLN